ncbi:hypothetical protein E2C01_065578 [Portunus trituberculatus]|uniref:Uncharacterized protein n=1 Tax=Portunus trituberculatus TaxID=210409 RepID=A0A5B7HS52_PORTR|nr:hypothetical protein [Portunus trituberculatus]
MNTIERKKKNSLKEEDVKEMKEKNEEVVVVVVVVWEERLTCTTATPVQTTTRPRQGVAMGGGALRGVFCGVEVVVMVVVVWLSARELTSQLCVTSPGPTCVLGRERRCRRRCIHQHNATDLPTVWLACVRVGERGTRTVAAAWPRGMIWQLCVVVVVVVWRAAAAAAAATPSHQCTARLSVVRSAAASRLPSGLTLFYGF